MNAKNLPRPRRGRPTGGDTYLRLFVAVAALAVKDALAPPRDLSQFDRDSALRFIQDPHIFLSLGISWRRYEAVLKEVFS